MHAHQPLCLSRLPEDMVRAISEYCNLPTRCAVTCTNLMLSSVFLGRVTLTEKGSEKFLIDKDFRQRLRKRVLRSSSNLILQVRIEKFTDSQIDILNSVRSVFVSLDASSLDPRWESQLYRIRTLTELRCIGKKFYNVSALVALTNLTKLSLSRTQVSDVWALAGLASLTSLDLSWTKVSDMSALAGLTKLTELALSYTQVSDVSALEGLTSLTHLELRSTRVSNLPALSGLTNVVIEM